MSPENFTVGNYPRVGRRRFQTAQYFSATDNVVLQGKPGGAGGVDHGVNYAGQQAGLPHDVAVGNHGLLDKRHLLREHVQSQVASAHDDSIGRGRDGLEVEQTLAGLALRNQL